MKSRQNSDNPWQYATYEGAERLQHQKTLKMTFSERLRALDNMIRLARGLHTDKGRRMKSSGSTEHFNGN